jgi:hypothetical protein
MIQVSSLESAKAGFLLALEVLQHFQGFFVALAEQP